MARLTKKVRQQLLDQNEGFTRRTYYEGCKFRPLSHTCTDFQPRYHGILATLSRGRATVARGAISPSGGWVDQDLSQRAIIFLACS